MSLYSITGVIAYMIQRSKALYMVTSVLVFEKQTVLYVHGSMFSVPYVLNVKSSGLFIIIIMNLPGKMANAECHYSSPGLEVKRLREK